MIWILAQTASREDYLRSMRTQFSQPKTDIWWQVLLGIGLIGGLIVLVWLIGAWQRRTRRAGEMAPLKLYRRVLKGIGLSISDSWRMWRLAKTARITHPSALLLSSELFDEAVASFCSGSGWFGGRSRQAPAFAAIRKQLFS